MPEEIEKEDVTAIIQKAKSGELAEDVEDIKDTLIGFDLKHFEALKEDKPGDPVITVLLGYVEEVDDDKVVVKFDKASVIHGKKKGDFKRLENELKKKGAYNPPALAAWIERKQGRTK